MRKILLSQGRFLRTALSVVTATSLLVACNNDALSPSTPVNSSQAGFQQQSRNVNLESVAKVLATALANPELRSLIKTEAAKKVDGDYDVLYATVQQSLLNNKTVVQQMKAAGISQDLAHQLPLLNLSVPVHIEKWDVATQAPLVAVVTDDEAAPIVAFDKNGNRQLLNPKKAPDFPVVVVGMSERYELLQGDKVVMKKGLFNPSELKTDNETLPDDGSGGGGGGGGGGPTDCNDLSKPNLVLTDWFTGDLSAIESWAKGTPEIRMRAFAINQNQQKIDVYGDPVRGNLWEPNHRSYIDGTWWTDPDDYLFYWNTSSYGEEVTFVLHEEDGGSPKDITIPISYKSGGFEVSTSITFRVDDGDDYVGHFPRRLPFCSGSEIGNHTLKFKVRRY